MLDHNEPCILHPYVDLIAWESERDTQKKLSLRSLRIAFVLYNLIPEDILIEKSAKKTPAGCLNLVSANKGLFQHTQYQS